MQEKKKSFTVFEAANELSVSPRTMKRIIEEKQITVFYVRGCVRITMEDINEFRERNKIKHAIRVPQSRYME